MRLGKLRIFQKIPDLQPCLEPEAEPPAHEAVVQGHLAQLQHVTHRPPEDRPIIVILFNKGMSSWDVISLLLQEPLENIILFLMDKDVIERLDQGHLFPNLEPFEQLINGYSELLNMSPRMPRLCNLFPGQRHFLRPSFPDNILSKLDYLQTNFTLLYLFARAGLPSWFRYE